MSLREAWEGQAANWLRWTRTPGHDHWFEEHNWPAFERLLPAPGRRTLDLGCGEGRVGERLRALGHTVVGVDASPTLAAAARDRGAYEQVVEADAAALPFQDAAFDLAIAFMSLHDMDDPAAAVREAGRVLEPGARFAIATLHPVNTAPVVGGYSDTRRYDETIERDGIPMTFSSWHLSLERYVAFLRGGGFVIEDLREIQVDDTPMPDLLHLVARAS
jgi:SAM-dependent methyltransferase